MFLSDSPDGLQTLLDNLADYCKRRELEVNLDKTIRIIFNKKGEILQNDFEFTYNGKKITVDNCVDYLGLKFEASGTFCVAEKHLADKAQKASFIIKYDITLDRNNMITPEVAFTLFDTYIKPIITYGSEIWSVATRWNSVTGKHHLFGNLHTKNLVNIQDSEKCTLISVSLFSESPTRPLIYQTSPN